MHFIFLFLIFQYSYGSILGRERPDFPYKCNMSQVDSCIKNHAIARDGEAKNIDPIVNAIENARNTIRNLNEILKSEQVKKFSLSKNTEFINFEVNFLEQSQNKLEENNPIYAGSASLEDLLSLKPDKINWLDNFQLEQINLLKTKASESQKNIILIEKQEEKLTNEINNSQNELNSLYIEYATHLEQYNLHDQMCKIGCKQEFCPNE